MTTSPENKKTKRLRVAVEFQASPLLYKFLRFLFASSSSCLLLLLLLLRSSGGTSRWKGLPDKAPTLSFPRHIKIQSKKPHVAKITKVTTAMNNKPRTYSDTSSASPLQRTITSLVLPNLTPAMRDAAGGYSKRENRKIVVKKKKKRHCCVRDILKKIDMVHAPSIRRAIGQSFPVNRSPIRQFPIPRHHCLAEHQ